MDRPTTDELEPDRGRRPRKIDRTDKGGGDNDRTDNAGLQKSGQDKPARAPRPDRELPTASDLQRNAERAVSRSRGPRLRVRRPLGARPQRAEEPAVHLKRVVGEPRDKNLMKRLRDAGAAFEGERFGDARSILQPVVKEAPDLPEGQELMGLALYRMGRWKEAIEHLEDFREITASTEQHPVLADCHRALRRWADVEALWAELGESSPAPEIVTEGRIVLAGAKADQGDIPGALRTLEKGWKYPKNPRPDHLRRAYALADLYERSGHTPRAREMFKWVEGHDPRLADVKSRVRGLS